MPPEFQQGAVEFEIDESTTPYDVIDHFGIPRDVVHLLMINGVYIPPEKRTKPLLSEGDVLAVWPPVAGG